MGDPMAFMMGMMGMIMADGGVLGGGKAKGKGKKGKDPWAGFEDKPLPTSHKEYSDWKSKGWVDYGNKEIPPEWKEQEWSLDPKVIKIVLPADSPIVAQGFLPEAPSIACYNPKAHDLFSQASNILQEIVGDCSTMVKIEHDTEGDQFPDVTKAVIEAGGDSDLAISVGVCPEAAKWAVGLGAGKQSRERAVKLSL